MADIETKIKNNRIINKLLKKKEITIKLVTENGKIIQRVIFNDRIQGSKSR